MTVTTKPASGAGAAPKGRALSGSLGVTAIVFMVVAAAAPLTVIGGAAPLGILIGNGVGFPSMYAISAVVLLLFSVGLAAMTKHVPKPGAFFTFVGYGLGKKAGLSSAFLALLTYTTIQVSVYGYIGYLLNVTVTGLGGPGHRVAALVARDHRPRRHPRLPPHRPVVEGARRAARRRGRHRARPRRCRGLRRRRRRTLPRAVRAGERDERIPGHRPDVRHRRIHRLRSHRDLPRRGQGPEPHHPARHLRRRHRHRPVLHPRLLGPRHGLGPGQRARRRR